MNCKDCIHNNVCTLWRAAENQDARAYAELSNGECGCFQDKSSFINPPCKIGQTVYRITKRYGHYEVLERTVLCLTYYRDYFGGISWSIFTTTEDKLGKTVFITREEAEAAIAERETP